MDLDELKREAKREGEVSETMAFRLSPQDKATFIRICDKLELSVGKVLRLMVKEFIEQGRK